MLTYSKIEEPVAICTARWLILAQEHYTSAHRTAIRSGFYNLNPPLIWYAAQRFGCGKTQVGQHYRSLKQYGIPWSRGGVSGRPPSLTAAEDSALEFYLRFAIDAGLQPTKALIQSMANIL